MSSVCVRAASIPLSAQANAGIVPRQAKIRCQDPPRRSERPKLKDFLGKPSLRAELTVTDSDRTLRAMALALRPKLQPALLSSDDKHLSAVCVCHDENWGPRCGRILPSAKLPIRTTVVGCCWTRSGFLPRLYLLLTIRWRVPDRCDLHREGRDSISRLRNFVG